MRAILTSLIALIPCVSQADVSLTYQQQTQCKSKMTALLISGSRLRFDSVMDNKKYSMLFDGTDEMMTTLDHSGRQYWQTEVDEDALDYSKDVMSSTGTFMDKQMQAMQAQMKQQCAQMEKQGFNCSNMPDLTSMMKNAQAMSAQQMPKIEIKQSDKNQVIAGMDCKTFDRYENGSKSSEECYVEPEDLLIPDKDKKYLLRNMNIMLHYSSSVSGFADKMQAINNLAPSQPDPADKNILLLQVCIAPNGDEVGHVEAQINIETIDSASFRTPPGYQLMSMGGQEQE
jgi:hypothetical protein